MHKTATNFFENFQNFLLVTSEPRDDRMHTVYRPTRGAAENKHAHRWLSMQCP
jgi:hypothetical protein